MNTYRIAIAGTLLTLLAIALSVVALTSTHSSSDSYDKTATTDSPTAHCGTHLGTKVSTDAGCMAE